MHRWRCGSPPARWRRVSSSASSPSTASTPDQRGFALRRRGAGQRHRLRQPRRRTVAGEVLIKGIDDLPADGGGRKSFAGHLQIMLCRLPASAISRGSRKGMTSLPPGRGQAQVQWTPMPPRLVESAAAGMPLWGAAGSRRWVPGRACRASAGRFSGRAASGNARARSWPFPAALAPGCGY